MLQTSRDLPNVRMTIRTWISPFIVNAWTWFVPVAEIATPISKTVARVIIISSVRFCQQRAPATMSSWFGIRHVFILYRPSGAGSWQQRWLVFNDGLRQRWPSTDRIEPTRQPWIPRRDHGRWPKLGWTCYRQPQPRQHRLLQLCHFGVHSSGRQSTVQSPFPRRPWENAWRDCLDQPRFSVR